MGSKTKKEKTPRGNTNNITPKGFPGGVKLSGGLPYTPTAETKEKTQQGLVCSTSTITTNKTVNLPSNFSCLHPLGLQALPGIYRDPV